MNTKRIVLTCFLCLILIKISGQSIEFSYDANGNRVSRVLVVEQLKSASATAASNTKNDAADLREEPVEITEISEVHVYPNPTKGLIRVEATGLAQSLSCEIRIYDLSGAEVHVEKNFSIPSEFDVNHLQDGMYILRIRIGDKTHDWKVIKNHF